MGFQPLIFNGFLVGATGGGGGSSPTIGGPVVGGTQGSVLFIGAGSTLAQDNANFNFNDSTHALTITGTFSASNFSGSSSGTNTGDITIGTSNGLSLTGQALSLALSSTSTTGALDSTDWNTFNNKQPSFTSQSANLFFASPNGSSGIPTFRSIVAADLPSLSGTYVTQSQVGAANGVASLDGTGKIPVGQLPNSVLQYQGTWNPSTNTPTLQDSTGTAGFVYWASAAFAGPISGLNNASMHNFQIGDLVIYNGSQWELTTPAAGVQSVNGFQGVVTLTQGNFTDSTAGADGITVTGGTNAVWGSGTSISQLAASGSQNGYLTSANFTTFNNKQSAGNYITTLTGDVTASGPGSAAATLTATTNSTITTLSSLSLPGSQVTGNISGDSVNITATSNNTLTTLSALSLPYSQVTGAPANLIFADSLVNTSGTATLVNDNASPGDSQYYGTNSSGTLGYYSLPISNGDLTQATFTAADNQSSPANITGFLFSNSIVRSFDALVSVTRNNTYASYKILGIQRAADWIISSTYSGDVTGLTFNMSPSGQMQYTSSSTGFTAKVDFRAITTGV